MPEGPSSAMVPLRLSDLWIAYTVRPSPRHQPPTHVTTASPPGQTCLERLARAVVIDAISVALQIPKQQEWTEAGIASWGIRVLAGQRALAIALLSPECLTRQNSSPGRERLREQYEALHWLAYGGADRDMWVDQAGVGCRGLDPAPWIGLALLWECQLPAYAILPMGEYNLRHGLRAAIRLHTRRTCRQGSYTRHATY